MTSFVAVITSEDLLLSSLFTCVPSFKVKYLSQFEYKKLCFF